MTKSAKQRKPRSKRSAGAILDTALGEPQDRRTIAEQVAERLRALILKGTLPPGTPLRVNPLAERLGLSAMPVRDALRLLEVEQLVESEPRRGAYVSALSIEDIEEVYAMRAALEGICARRATELATRSDMADLQTLYDALEMASRDDDVDAFIAADRAFHDHLYGLSDRVRTMRTLAVLHTRSRRYVPYAYRDWGPLDVALAEHRLILDAVKAGDALEVRRLTHEHLDEAAERLMAAVRSEGSLS